MPEHGEGYTGSLDDDADASHAYNQAQKQEAETQRYFTRGAWPMECRNGCFRCLNDVTDEVSTLRSSVRGAQEAAIQNGVWLSEARDETAALRVDLNEALEGWNREKQLRKTLCNEADERIERMQQDLNALRDERNQFRRAAQFEAKTVELMRPVIDGFCRVDDTANTNEQLAAVREAYELLRAYREDAGA